MSYLCVALVLFGIDQLTKIFLYGTEMSLIGDFLWLKKVGLNYGAGWSMFSGGRWWFIGFSIVVAVIIIYLIVQKKYFNSSFFKLSLGIMLGGLLGNMYDRIALGGVRDFLAFNFFDFPVFNVADIAITVATIMLMIYILFLNGDNKLNNNKKEQKINGEDTNSK